MIRALETGRLLLLPLELTDAAQVQAIFPHWEIVRYLDSKVPWPFPEDGVHAYYRDLALPAMERGEEWHWTLRLKTAPETIIGSIALLKSDDHNRGFWIGSQWQGRGLMSEASEAVNEFWFAELGFPILRVQKAAANLPSSRISEKNGMRRTGIVEKEYVGGKMPSQLWELTAEEWRARHNSSSTRTTGPDLKVS